MCVKKFIFSKFAGLQNYSWQLYYQTNFFTDIFRQYFKSSHAPPMYWLKPPHQILKRPPMFSTPVGDSGSHNGGCSQTMNTIFADHFTISNTNPNKKPQTLQEKTEIPKEPMSTTGTKMLQFHESILPYFNISWNNTNDQKLYWIKLFFTELIFSKNVRNW